MVAADADWENQTGRVKIRTMADIDRDRDKNFTFRIMKMNCWLTLGVMMVTSAIAQDNANTASQIPAPTAPPPAEVAPAAMVVETNAPPANAKPAKHKKHKAVAAE